MKTWTLTHTDEDDHLDALHVTAGDAGITSAIDIRKRTLHGGLREGVDVIEIDNGTLQFTVVPTRGMSLWRIGLGDLHVGWQSPVRGPVHPQFVPVDAPNGIGWLTGFDEFLVRCGLASNGAPQFADSGKLEFPLHGRIANLPAHTVQITLDQAKHTIAVTGIVEEARLFDRKLRLKTTYTTRFDEPRLSVVDEVTNLSAEPTDMQLLYHINFGAPLCTPGSRVVAPIGTLAPRDAHSATDIASWNTYGAAEAGLQEYGHFAELVADDVGWTRAMIVAADLARGCSLAFNRKQLPCFTLWKSQRLPADGYVTGLEPGTNYPNVRRHEQQQGRIVPLAPGETRRFDVTVEVHPTAESANAPAAEIANLGRGIEPTIHQGPMPGWSMI